MTSVADHLAATADPLGLGSGSPDFLDLGYGLTLGGVFPWPEGRIVLRRRKLYPVPEERWHFVGLAPLDALTINNDVAHEWDAAEHLGLPLWHRFATGEPLLTFPFFPRRSTSAYQYSAGRVLGNGYVSDWTEPTRVDFDQDRELITPPLPMPPVSVTAFPLDGRRYRVIWEYDPFGQGGDPADFQVFSGTNAYDVNYDDPLVDAETDLNVVSFHGGKRRYEFTTPIYVAASMRTFGVRGRNVDGIVEENRLVSAMKRTAGTPPPRARVLMTAGRR